MQTVTATALRQNLFTLLSNSIKYDEPLLITTKTGNAVVISEEEYRGLLETQYLNSVPGLAQELIARGNAPDKDFVPIEETGWLTSK